MVNKGGKKLKRKSYSTNGAGITSYSFAKKSYHRQKLTPNGMKTEIKS